MWKKGFTLIELLAVIVILAIIALIATPMVLNTIEESKKGAAVSSTYGYIDAIQNKVASGLINNKIYEDRDDYVYDEIQVDVKGEKPSGGTYSLKEGVVTSGIFCINGYEVSYSDNKAEVHAKCTGEELKQPGIVELSETSRYYTYLESETFEVIKNISGGELSCRSDDEEVATCSISGTTVTVTAGEKDGSATITVISAGTSKYKEAQAAYVARTIKGSLSVTTNGYEGVYDGEAHGITVSCENSIIKYGTEKGTYNLETSPTYTDVGEYIVYYEIVTAEYEPITGYRTVVITKADGKISLEAENGIVEYNKTSTVEIKENVSRGEITVTVENPDIVEANIIDGKLNIKGKQVGRTKVTLLVAGTNNYKEVSTEYDVEVVKANNTLTLSSNSANYTYPDEGTFEVIENTSKGKLSCESDNEDVATCTVNDNIVKVIPGTAEGYATLTIKSEATENYNEGTAAHVATTIKGVLQSYTATEYKGVYDGKAHGITVECSGATIKYRTTESGEYTLTENPIYTNVGEYTVYYQIIKEGYNTVEGSKTVVITKAEGAVVAPTAKTLTYTGNVQALINEGSTTTGTIEYRLEDGSYSTVVPTATSPGTYTVYYRVLGDMNHNDIEEKRIEVMINKAIIQYTTSGYNQAYDGQSHGIIVISENATIKYGTEDGIYNLDSSPTYVDAGQYTVYYQITREGYIDVTGSEKVVITKADHTLKLSASSGSYTYPDEGTFEIQENISEGALSCKSDKENVATCTIEGNVVTVTPGTTEGYATLTIKSESTNNYNETQAAYVATTVNGALQSYTATEYEGVYDGEAHGITVECSGATIKYRTTESGEYILTENPTYTDPGTYTVYFEITKPGYKTVTGSKTVIINSLSASSVSYTNSSISSITNVEEALDYLDEKLK